MFHARPGGGASPGGDGWSSIGEWHTVGGLKFGSIEVAEARFPLHFRHHEFLADSGGDGQHRGGLGVALDLVVETEKLALGNTAGDGIRYGCLRHARRRGRRAASLSPAVAKAGRRASLHTKEIGIEIRPGDCLEVRSAAAAGGCRRRHAARERDRQGARRRRKGEQRLRAKWKPVSVRKRVRSSASC